MLELVFLTTNKAKLAHARHLCREYDLTIAQQKHYGVGYNEPRTQNRDELLERSIEDAIKRWNKTVSRPEDKFFFLEDTSVIIHALSKEEEYPGVDVKYWMRDHDFSAVDKLLKGAGNDRRVTVRSDIVLALPKALQQKEGKKYKRFTGGVDGEIVGKEIDIKTQPLYPWLDNKTFNKWFIPEGAKKPISLLNIRDADKYDFRAEAFRQMIAFLEKYNLVEKNKLDDRNERQYGFEFLQPIFLIMGPTCSGKTSLAQYLANNYGYYHVEASDYMYLSYYERLGVNSNISIGDFAQQALLENPNIVVDQILKLSDMLGDTPIAITGFRSEKELDAFVRKYHGALATKSVFISARQDIRMDRYLKRVRAGYTMTKSAFLKVDRQQGRMGIWGLKKRLRECCVENEASLARYYKRFEREFRDELGVKIINEKHYVGVGFIPERLGDEIIVSLAAQKPLNEYFTTAEIAQIINKYFNYMDRPKSKNNVSRYFNQYFYPYYEIEVRNGKRSYRLSHTGLSRARWLTSAR